MFPEDTFGASLKILGKTPVQAAAINKRIAAERTAPLAHFSQGSGTCPWQISGYADFKAAEVFFVNMGILLLDS
jgi:hypothetical protein